MSPLSLPPLACTGHALVDLPLFMGPVVVLVGWLLLTTRRARRRDQAADQVPAQALESRNVEHPIGVHA